MIHFSESETADRRTGHGRGACFPVQPLTKRRLPEQHTAPGTSDATPGRLRKQQQTRTTHNQSKHA
ncbi:hypothetical protein AMQ83_25700, partial [Paenibacillus riograndensis]